MTMFIGITAMTRPARASICIVYPSIIECPSAGLFLVYAISLRRYSESIGVPERL